MMKILTSIALVLLFTVAGLAQRTEPVSRTELAEITERGRMLYAYDVASWYSTDAVAALIIEFSVPEGMKLETGYHTAILDDAPEDTDVFHVLARQPKIAELVVTNRYVYRIAEDGMATYLMTKEAFTKVGKNPQ